jgi:hypothetical protein
MSELHTDTAPTPSSEASLKSNCITSSGSISDPSLSQLREQIKNAMIPLLIKVFHLRLEVQQASSPPSRLHHKTTKAPIDDLVVQLQKLDEDLKLLQLWSQSCRNQVHKVLQEAQEDLTQSPPNQFHSKSQTHPGMQKSFAEAVSSQQESAKQAKSLQAYSKESHDNDSNHSALEKESDESPRPWWQKMLGK